MAIVHGTHYSMEATKLAEVARLAGISLDAARDYCLDGDWPEGQEHQDWLDNAPAQEIADWIPECVES